MTSFLSKSRPFRLTRPGWIFILYTIGVGAGAINTGNNLLYLVFGIFLGLILASGFLSDISLWQVRVDVEWPAFATVGQPTVLFVRIRNQKKWFPAMAARVVLELEAPAATSPLHAYVPYLPSKETMTLGVPFVPSRRGKWGLRRVRLETKYPFGLLHKWWTLHAPVSAAILLATPALVPGLTLDDVLVAGRLPEEATAREKGEGPTIHGVREFRSGDNPRLVHWRASAKRPMTESGNLPLVVRETEKEEKPTVWLRLPAPGDLRAWPESETERFVSFVATALDCCDRAGFRPVLLLAQEPALAQRAISEREHDRLSFLALWKPTEPLGVDMEPYVSALSATVAATEAMDLLRAFQRPRGAERG